MPELCLVTLTGIKIDGKRTSLVDAGESYICVNGRLDFRAW